jgi:hypothetical protein
MSNQVCRSSLDRTRSSLSKIPKGRGATNVFCVLVILSLVAPNLPLSPLWKPRAASIDPPDNAYYLFYGYTGSSKVVLRFELGFSSQR